MFKLIKLYKFAYIRLIISQKYIIILGNKYQNNEIYGTKITSKVHNNMSQIMTKNLIFGQILQENLGLLEYFSRYYNIEFS